MKIEIVRVDELQDCFDGSYSRNVTLNIRINEEILTKLCNKYESVYLKDLPKPFYRISINDRYILKGFQNESVIEVNFRGAYNIDELIILFNIINEDIS